MSDIYYMLRPAFKFSYDEKADLTWVQAFPYGSWKHPVYGDIEFNQEKLQAFKENFDSGVMQQTVPWTYEHGSDPAKGNKAAGTIEAFEIREDGGYCGLKLTPTALKELQDGEWLYVSPEYKDEWTSQATGETHSNVLWGGSFTNYPFLKGIAPVNLSELGAIVAEVADKEHSDPGTGIGGEPGPRTDYDRIAPAPPATPPLPSPNVTPPGGFPPQQRHYVNGTGNLIFSEGGVNKVDEAELRKLFNIPEGADLTKFLSDLKRDAETQRMSSADADKAKKFAEAFPEEAKRLAELADRDRRSQAKEFAENFRSITTDAGRTVRLSPVAITKAEELALKFSEGAVTVEDFGEMLETIAKTGIVELGERGTSAQPEDDGVSDATSAATRLSDMARALVLEAKGNGKEITLADASNQVARENPALFAAYRRGVPTGAPR